MRRFILTIISSCAVLFAFAQEEIVLDTISKYKGEVDTRQFTTEKPLLSDDSFVPEKLNLFDNSLFTQPLLPSWNKNLDFLKYLGSSGVSTESYTISGFGYSPFFLNGKVFNQATYRLNERFSFGGNSFGAQSVFDKPKLNPAIQDMNTKGASMFLQYKVSKNFKVEGRVSISNRSNPWEP